MSEIGQDTRRRAAAIDDPGYGADPVLTVPGAGPAVPEARQPNMAEMPADDFSDDDLLTDEEMQDRLGQMVALVKTGMDHDANLAEVMDKRDLDDLGQEIIEKVEADEQSNQKYKQRFARGLQVLGLENFVWDSGKAPFEGASTVTHTMLGEACIQSQARFMEELFPASGPVKTMVMGVETPEKRDAADRVSNHMNYQLTVEDETYFMETQKLALYLPAFGCAYRKAYHDWVEDRNVLRYVTGEDLILPYNARSVNDTPRRTHRFKLSREELAIAVAARAYVDVDLPEASEASPDQVDEAKDRQDGKEPVEHQDDPEWEIYEIDIKLDLKGFEDTDQDGRKTKIPLPYTVTVEKESGKVLAVRRCWDQDDPLKKMLDRYAEYWYLPGFGSKGMGLIHWIGAVADAGTDALRALLDAATWANMQGGFKAKDAGVKAGEMHMKPGAWLDVDMTAEELGKAFHTPPFKEPSETLFKLLGFLTDLARRFAGTTELMVGEQDAKGAPVGTTIALIEQGSKVYSGVHKRAHFAQGIEFRMLFRLNSIYIPDAGYPYLVPGDDRAVYRQDYDTQVVSVVPISDPNIYSQTQRIALAQTRYQIAKDNPAYFRQFETLESLLKAFKDPEIEATLVDPNNVPWMDPVSENVAMVTGRPVLAKDGENHDAHLIVHMSFMQHPQFGGLPQAQQLLGPAMMAHIAEHVALKYAEVQRRLGVAVPAINLSAQIGDSISQGQDPGQNDQVAMAAAQMVQAFMQQSGLTTTPPGTAAADEEGQANLELTRAQTWSAITAGLANMAKVGMSLEQAEAAQQSIEAMGGAGGAGPSGALAAPGKMAAPRPPVARPGPAGPKRAVAPAPSPALAGPDQGGAPGHDENNDGAGPALNQ